MNNIESFIDWCVHQSISFTLEQGDKLKINAASGVLTESVVIQLKQLKPEIISWLKAQDKKKIYPRDNTIENVELSFSQQRLWLLDRLNQGSAEYNMPAAFRVDGEFDVSHAEQAITRIIQRHEILRTVYLAADNGALQRVRQHFGFSIQRYDLTSVAEDEKQQQLQLLIEEDVNQSFDLSQDLMIRVSFILLATGPTAVCQQGVLLFNIHHIASDGWSLKNLVHEFTLLYQALTTQTVALLPPVGIQYADYALWQRSWLQGDVLEKQLNYWQTQLSNVPEVHSLPLDFDRTESTLARGGREQGQLSATKARQLQLLAKSLQLTPFMLVHGALALVFARHSNSCDIVVGTPVANRIQLELEPLIGFFVNTLVLRLDTAQSTLAEYFAHVRQVHLAAQSHQDVPFEKLVERLNIPRSHTHSPLFQIFLSTNTEFEIAGDALAQSLTLDKVRLSPEPSEYIVTKFDLDITVNISASGVTSDWIYNSGLFLPERVKQLNEHFCRLLDNLSALDPSTLSSLRLADLPMLSAVETKLLVQQLNATARDYSADLRLHQLFERQCLRSPGQTALICAGEQLSYQELNTRANQFARYLQSAGVTAGSFVGVCLDRSSDMMVVILAILKAGAAYIPFDPDYPVQRLNYMLQDSQLQMMICQRDLLPALQQNQLQWLYYDELSALLSRYSSENIEPTTALRTHLPLCYVIYTSGSTGQPKGVQVPHSSVVNFLLSMSEQPGMTADDCLLAVTSTSFDIHVLELFLPLITGAVLLLAPTSAMRDPEHLKNLMAHHPVSVMQATPATWKMLLDSGWQTFRPLKVLCGGEALSRALARQLLVQPTISLWNMYGPTETTVWSSLQQIKAEDEKICIGRPVHNTQFYVMSAQQELVPFGAVGELLIGGAGVTAGYLNRPELTSRQFIANPYYRASEQHSSPYLYRTGDLVRWLPDHSMECFGRMDQQVKIRGYRIELGEVEAILASHPQVKEAVVLAQNTEDEESRLIGYVIPAQEVSTEPATALHTATSSQINFSLFYFGGDSYDQQDKYKLYLDSARFADSHDFEAIWTPERHFDRIGSLYPNPSVLNAALATITRQIKLRSGSVVLPLHDPIRVAEEWSMVDNLSHGRVGLALAPGWHSRDFALQPENYQHRKEKLKQGITELKQLWAGQSIIRKDGLGQDVELTIFPKPVQARLPLWLTVAGNPESFIEAGRQGVNLLTHLIGQTSDDLARNIALYRTSLAQHGFDPAQGQVTLMIHTYLAADIGSAVAEARGPFIKYMLGHIGLLKPILDSLEIAGTETASVDMESIAAIAFERYVNTVSLIGTPESVLPIVDAAVQAGVNEIACLIDWMDVSQATAGLEHILRLKQAAQQPRIDPQQLLQYCRQQLPDYMVPSALMMLTEWPLTPNGKIDKKALPVVELMSSAQKFIAPETDIEVALAAIWEDLFGIKQVSLSDNFFQLGGNSLLAIRLISKINKELQVTLPLRTVVNSQTLGALASALAEEGRQLVRPVLARIPRDSVMLASFAQQRIWFIDQLNGQSSEYNKSLAFEVEGNFSPEAAEQAINQIVRRHEVLRTVYQASPLGTVQKIYPEADFRLTTLNISHLSEKEQQNVLMQLLNEDAQRPFDLSEDLMVRASYIALQQDTDKNQRVKGVLLFNIHHIASDGWSMQVLLREFVTYYRIAMGLSDDPLAELNIQYADYAHWQRQWLSGGELDKQLGYWIAHLQDAPSLHGVPLDRPRPAIKQRLGERITDTLSAAVSKQLQKVAKEFRLTPFMLVHAALSLVLSRHSNSHDIVIGVPVANRVESQLESLIGFFVNTLVLRLNTEFDTLAGYFQHVRQIHLDAQTHQDVPFEKLVEHLNVPRTMSYTPLFQIVLNTDMDYGLQDTAADSDVRLPGVIVKSLNSQHITAKFDLDIRIDVTDDGVELDWVYDCAIFEREHISRLNQHLTTLLNAMADLNPSSSDAASIKLNSLPMLLPAEETHLLEELNATKVAWPIQYPVHQLFEQQTLKVPEQIAVIAGTESLRYQQLNERANQLAHLLRASGVENNDRIGIYLDRSVTMIVAILAVLKAGAAYVPMDPAAPVSRLSYMAENSALTLVLTTAELALKLPATVCRWFALDEPDVAALIAGSAKHNIQPSEPAELAYVIYTSGSTGQPKGVAVTHSNLTNYVLGVQQRFEVVEQLSYGVLSSITTDLGNTSIYLGLACQGTLHLMLEEQITNSELFARYMQQHQLDLLKLTPSHFSALFPLQSLDWQFNARWLVLGGERITADVAEKIKLLLAKNVRVFNHFGPTETTIGCCVHTFSATTDWHNIPIGRPLPNVQLYVLSPSQQLLPYGAIGCLHVAGAGVASGYIGQPELTAKSFIWCSLKEGAPVRMYNTGDLVRYLPDGQLQFLGRADEQLKIRGFRIELGEIEYQLSQCSAVQSYLVVANKDDPEQPRIIAYVICKTGELNLAEQEGASVDEAKQLSEIRLQLRETLPAHMIPAAIVTVTEWPLMLNGKIDRKLLPVPVGGATGAYVAATTETEQKLVAIWASLLHKTDADISIQADFFDLGGHSLLAIRLLTMLQDTFNIEFSIKDIFERKTIKSLADHIENYDWLHSSDEIAEDETFEDFQL
ncbi:MAG: amino acid adenylation domain-containing protein [Gammaproteobacteria bacterium]|nr:amino acid adenylation domain-containing protein [Gammaproteobacteria bacterium]MBU2395787.1 amino acid adenylation domain-containing protein [Gammaproteobacteria bacterium]